MHAFKRSRNTQRGGGHPPAAAPWNPSSCAVRAPVPVCCSLHHLIYRVLSYGKVVADWTGSVPGQSLTTRAVCLGTLAESADRVAIHTPIEPTTEKWEPGTGRQPQRRTSVVFPSSPSRTQRHNPRRQDALQPSSSPAVYPIPSLAMPRNNFKFVLRSECDAPSKKGGATARRTDRRPRSEPQMFELHARPSFRSIPACCRDRAPGTAARRGRPPINVSSECIYGARTPPHGRSER
jgi:hypothetical protein